MLIYKVKLATVVDGDLKAPFSIATTLRLKGEHYSFPWIAHFTLDTYIIMLSAKQGGITTIFWVFSMTRPGIEPQSPGLLGNTLPIRPIYIYIYKNCRHNRFIPALLL